MSSHVKLSPFEIELIYAGRSLKDDMKMEQYGLKPGCTVHVLVKKYREDPAMITEPEHSEGGSIWGTGGGKKCFAGGVDTM